MNSRLFRVVCCALATLLLRADGSMQGRATIQVTPAAVIEGEPVSLTITGLKARQEIVLHACRNWDLYPKGSEPYYGRTTLVSDAGGNIAITESRPFWSMTALRVLKIASPACEASGLRAGEVALVVEADGELIARTSVMLAIAAAGVTVTDVRTKGVVGVFAAPAPGAPRPGVILLGGSEGGLFTARSLAPLFASHGFATLGVGYFGEELPGLPPNLASIPVETVARAREWLHAQPGVDPKRIAIVGVSKGAELALVAAAHYRWVDAVAAFAPSHIVWEGIPSPTGSGGRGLSSWTIAGRPMPFVRWSYTAEARGSEARKATQRSRLTEAHLESLAEFSGDVERATIRIERSRAALMLVAGTDDGMWPSAYAVERIAARLARHRYDRPIKIVRLTTGHQVLGTGWAPTTAFNRDTGRLQGGSPELDARAQAEAWPQLLEFLRIHLR